VRLAYITNYFPFALAEQFFEPEVRGLARRADVFVVAAHPRERVDRYPGLGAHPHYLARFDGEVSRRARREIRRNPAAVARIARAVFAPRYAARSKVVNAIVFAKGLALAHDLRRFGVDRIHANWLTTPGTTAFVAAALTGIPISFTAHQHDIFYDNLIAEKVAQATFVRVISERNLRHLRERLPPELHAKCIALHLGVDLPPAADVREPPPRAAPRLLCSARLCEWKGHRHLLEALARLRDRGVPFSCDLAGDGEIRAKVEAHVARLGLGVRVRMLGNVPHRKLAAALVGGEYDLATLASTERPGEHEGIPVALMEAMAAALPVVATNSGSTGELVDPACGALVPPGDPAALAAALEPLLVDPVARRRAGRCGRARVERSFATEVTTHALYALIAT